MKRRTRLRRSFLHIVSLISGCFLLCFCLSVGLDDYIYDPSTCSKAATRRGPGQKVISYSFFGPVEDHQGLNWYSKGLIDNAQLIPQFYGSNWTMRIYHDKSRKNKEDLTFLNNLVSNFKHVDLCYIEKIPGMGDLHDLEPTIWRFLPLADPLVDIFHSRDLDSRPSERELAAVQEFHDLPSKSFHLMKDHKQHHGRVLAGLWGAKPMNNRPMMKKIFSEIMEASKHKAFEDNKWNDQIILADVLGPLLNGKVLAHDSYHCGEDRLDETRPFPTQRKEESYNFVGSQMFGNVEPYLEVCPPPCRLQENWRLC